MKNRVKYFWDTYFKNDEAARRFWNFRYDDDFEIYLGDLTGNLPQKIGQDWDEMLAIIKKCENEIVKVDFSDGEQFAYRFQLQCLRDHLLPLLKLKLANKSWGLKFSCTPRHLNNLYLKVIINGVHIEVLSQFYDNYSFDKSNVYSCWQEVCQELRDALEIIKQIKSAE